MYLSFHFHWVKGLKKGRRDSTSRFIYASYQCWQQTHLLKACKAAKEPCFAGLSDSQIPSSSPGPALHCIQNIPRQSLKKSLLCPVAALDPDPKKASAATLQQTPSWWTLLTILGTNTNNSPKTKQTNRNDHRSLRLLTQIAAAEVPPKWARDGKSDPVPPASDSLHAKP